MLLANTQQPETFSLLLTNKVWQEALNWIKNMSTNLPEGEHEIAGKNMFANLHSANTTPRTEGIFEMHQQYIDLHYCIAGGEKIEYTATKQLVSNNDYDPDKDYQLFNVPAKASSCLLKPTDFAIFLPSEPHMPKIEDGEHKTIKKVVIKINKDLFN